MRRQTLPGVIEHDPLDEKVEEAAEIVERAIELYRPSSKWALFSGGHDSLVSTHLLMEHFDFDGVLHINTNIGFSKTRRFVRDICDEYGWDLKIYSAEGYENHKGEPRPQIYEELVVPPEVRRGELTWLERGGFPGPNDVAHGKFFDRLKGRPLQHFLRDHCRGVEIDDDSKLPTKTRDDGIDEADHFVDGRRDATYDRVLLCSGVYTDESNRRFQLAGREIDRDGSQLWVNPCLYWKSEHMEAYHEQIDGSPRNPVYATYPGSGECVCGAFSKPGEKQSIGETESSTYQRICDLEEMAYEHGYCWGYEEGPPQPVIDAKKTLREDDDGQLEISVSQQHACSTCGGGFWQGRDLETFRQVWGEDVEQKMCEALAKIDEREQEKGSP